MYFDFGVNIFTAFVLVLMIEYGTCLKCFSCHSKTDRSCDDPFLADYNTSRIIDCSEEASTREFVSYFSKLMGSLGIPVNVDDNSFKMEDTNKPSACQKVEIDDSGNRVTIRQCAVLSDTACDSLRRDNDDADVPSVVLFCDVCATDYCNRSFGVFVEWHSLLTIVSIGVIMHSTALNRLFLFA